jgi:undecaprenyl diphosphate synthase
MVDIIGSSIPAGACPLKHVAIIMDGNNRWAKQQGLTGIAGHRAGAERVRDALQSCKKHNVDVLTLFAFSTENWRRPAVEVQGLMSIFAAYLKKEVKELLERDVRLRVIGSRDHLSKRLCKLIDESEVLTRHGKQTLVLAVDYGGQWDIAQAARKLAEKAVAGDLRCEDISEEVFAEQLCGADLPPIDLCIRTAGEQRISNFLLWKLAYAEFSFSSAYWPDFTKTVFDDAVKDYYHRQRRFGMTGEQIDAKGLANA